MGGNENTNHNVGVAVIFLCCLTGRTVAILIELRACLVQQVNGNSHGLQSDIQSILVIVVLVIPLNSAKMIALPTNRILVFNIIYL